MKITILTLFPEMFEGPLNYSIIKRARERKLIDIEIINIRDFALDKHKTVDDHPYGGGVGMVLRVDILERAIKSAISKNIKKTRVILLDPRGKVFNQKKASQLSKFGQLILICGHYEGVDERLRKFIDEEISIGDYILTGGEIPAMVVADAIIRLLPKVLEKEQAIREESFGLNGFLEHPQYTRPPTYKKLRVPKVLLSGNHKKIRQWRQKRGEHLTKKLRPDLFNQRG